MSYSELKAEVETLIALGSQSDILDLLTPENVAIVQRCHPVTPVEEFVVTFRWVDWYAEGSKIATNMAFVADADAAFAYFSSTGAAALAVYLQTVDSRPGASALIAIDARYKEKTSDVC